MAISAVVRKLWKGVKYAMKRNGFVIMKRLLVLIRPLMKTMMSAVFFGVVGHLCASFITVFGGFGILKVISPAGNESFKVLFISICVFALLRGVLRYKEQSCNHDLAFKVLALLRDQVFQSLRKLCPAKLEEKDKGDLVTILTADIELLEVFYAHTISPILIAIIYSLVMCFFIGSYHVVLGLIAFMAYFFIGGILPVVISKMSGDDGLKFQTKTGELSSFVLESLRGMDEIIQYHQNEKRMEKMKEKTIALISDEERLNKMAAKNQALTQSLILLFDLVMLMTSAIFYQKSWITFDGVLISTLALMSSFGPCVALANLGSTLQHTFAAGNRVLDILDEIPVVNEISNQKEIEFKGALAKHVSFSYGQEKILDDVSIEIPKGSLIGIEGKSGSGKSTFLKLLMRFWEVQSGNIQISKSNIDKINTSNLRNMESYVTQETHLFHDSIKNNIKIAKLDASDEEIESACKKASIHDFIKSLPLGYETPVAELGESLSGGERQRIGLARAFLHDAPFMLLDEPTSNLDSLNEAIILKSVQEEKQDKTVVLVSHRFSTLKRADKIYSVECGRMS